MQNDRPGWYLDKENAIKNTIAVSWPSDRLIANQIRERENSEAVVVLKAFIRNNGIETLNVAGSRESKDALIYNKVFDVVEGAVLSS